METIYDSEYISLIETVRKLREDKKLTQTQLGELLGKDQTFVSKYESRERRLDVLELRNICNALGCSFLDIVSKIDQSVSATPIDEEVEEVQSVVTDTFIS